MVATSPALIPITSARVATIRIRSWGQSESDMDHLPPSPAGHAPYLGGFADSCGRFRPTPQGASVVKALVVDGDEIDRRTIGPESFVFHFADGLSDQTRERLDDRFGSSQVYDIGPATRLRVAAAVWWPQTLAAVAAWFTVRRFRRRRSIASRPDTPGSP